MAFRILVVVSSHPELAGEPNGTYLPELTHALHALNAHGVEFDIASPAGGALPFYGADADELTTSMLADEGFRARLDRTDRLDEVDVDRYDALFYPGGYGLLFDLVDNEDSQRLTAAMIERKRPVAAVCHGPAALSRVVLSDGRALVADRHVTGFTHEEEVAMNTLEAVPFLVGKTLVEHGAIYRKRAAWDVHVVEDGMLITGQNPASAAGVGEALARRLKEASHE